MEPDHARSQKKERSSDGSVSVPAAAFLSRTSPLGLESRLPSCAVQCVYGAEWRALDHAVSFCFYYFVRFCMYLFCLSSFSCTVFLIRRQDDASKIWIVMDQSLTFRIMWILIDSKKSGLALLQHYWGLADVRERRKGEAPFPWAGTFLFPGTGTGEPLGAKQRNMEPISF